MDHHLTKNSKINKKGIIFTKYPFKHDTFYGYHDLDRLYEIPFEEVYKASV